MEIKRDRLLISSVLVGLLGVLITVFSIYHAVHMGDSLWQYPLFLYGTTILSLAVGGLVTYLFEERINNSQLEKLLSVLPPAERVVMKLLIERREVEQKRLGTLSGLSRVKVSRVISVFEQRGVIEKKKQGYTNLIILRL